jgi:hypothetical protein
MGIVHGDAKAGWWIEDGYASFNEPAEVITNRYRISGARPARGNYGPAPVLAPGLDVRYVRDSAYPNADAKGGKTVRWLAYKDGSYLEVEADCEAFEQVITPLPCPKVRKGIDTRYRQGAWEKYLKSEGWVKA